MCPSQFIGQLDNSQFHPHKLSPVHGTPGRVSPKSRLSKSNFRIHNKFPCIEIQGTLVKARWHQQKTTKKERTGPRHADKQQQNDRFNSITSLYFLCSLLFIIYTNNITSSSMYKLSLIIKHNSKFTNFHVLYKMEGSPGAGGG